MNSRRLEVKLLLPKLYICPPKLTSGLRSQLVLGRDKTSRA
ncbi:hypothetical protein PSPO01_16457 [Paraphaeosphaeria sporulosa]